MQSRTKSRFVVMKARTKQMQPSAKSPTLYSETNFPKYDTLETWGVHGLSQNTYNSVKARYIGTPIPARDPRIMMSDEADALRWHEQVIADAIEYEL